ncbi:hydrogenase formation protein HypD [Streptomyces sp. GD-15H]|uniref:hydrogenase formation protein HypD n=1 Tax=Streptomyces sp. GD-15H TaxID=3129112 RepID=UPI00325144B2
MTGFSGSSGFSEFSFSCTGVRADAYAAGPTLVFRLRITASGTTRVHALALRCQIRVEPARRGYDDTEAAALTDLFGERSRWGSSLNPVQFAQVSVMVPGFTGETETDLVVPCTYDTDIAASRYFRALSEGEVPLLMLFSGTAFTGAGGFHVEPVPWDKEIASRPDVVFCSFGDMLRVPGTGRDLFQVRGTGGDVRVVYSPLDALRIAQQNPDRQVVFFGIGFETTAPPNAMTVYQALKLGIRNFSLLVSHVRVPPAIEAIMQSPNCRVQAFLAAGHVRSVMGMDEYPELAERFRVPIVVTGFEPLDILEGVRRTVRQLEHGEHTVDNAYPRAVRPEGSCVYPGVQNLLLAARDVGRSITVPVETTGPVVAPGFFAPAAGTAAWRPRFERYAPGRPPVVPSAGAWGAASALGRTARLLAAAGFLPVVLCGRNERLRARLAGVPGALVPDWVTDMPGLLRAARVLVDNAAGQTAVQALASGLPVVGYRPLPGHGTEGVRRMAALGVSEIAPDHHLAARPAAVVGGRRVPGPPDRPRAGALPGGRAGTGGRTRRHVPRVIRRNSREEAPTPCTTCRTPGARTVARPAGVGGAAARLQKDVRGQCEHGSPCDAPARASHALPAFLTSGPSPHEGGHADPWV